MIFSRKISHFSHKNTFFSCYVLQIWKKSITFAAKNEINRALVAKKLEKCSIMETKDNKQERVNPTWEAAMKTQGSIIINDPAWRI
ncbi:MAG: hypothetical protein KBS70_07965 [Bacteroidales bacterium]|nr:hypothetical protein [Candidatus Colicola equi]